MDGFAIAFCENKSFYTIFFPDKQGEKAKRF